MHLILLLFISSFVYAASSSSSNGSVSLRRDTFFDTSCPFPLNYIPKRSDDDLTRNLLGICVLASNNAYEIASKNKPFLDSPDFIEVAKKNSSYQDLYRYGITRCASLLYSNQCQLEALSFISSLLTFNEEVYGHAYRNLYPQTIAMLVNGFHHPDAHIRAAVHNLFLPEHQHCWKKELTSLYPEAMNIMFNECGQHLPIKDYNQLRTWIYGRFNNLDVHVTPSAYDPIKKYLCLQGFPHLERKFAMSNVRASKKDERGKLSFEYFLQLGDFTPENQKHKFDFLNIAISARNKDAIRYAITNGRTLFYNNLPRSLSSIGIISEIDPQTITWSDEPSSSDEPSPINLAREIQAANFLSGMYLKTTANNQESRLKKAQEKLIAAQKGPDKNMAAHARIIEADIINKQESSVKAYDNLMLEFQKKPELKPFYFETALHRALTYGTVSASSIDAQQKKSYSILAKKSLDTALESKNPYIKLAADIFQISTQLTGLQPNNTSRFNTKLQNHQQQLLTIHQKITKHITLLSEEKTIIGAMQEYHWHILEEQVVRNLIYIAKRLDDTKRHRQLIIHSLGNALTSYYNVHLLTLAKELLAKKSTRPELHEFLQRCLEKNRFSHSVHEALGALAAIRKDPSAHLSYFQAGQLSYDYSHYYEAAKQCSDPDLREHYFNKAIKIAPAEDNIHAKIANYYINNGEHLKAYNVLKKGDMSNPFMQAHIGLLQLLGVSDKILDEISYDEAYQNLQAIEHVPGTTSISGRLTLYKDVAEAYVKVNAELQRIKAERAGNISLRDLLPCLHNACQELKTEMIDFLTPPHAVRTEACLALAHLYMQAHKMISHEKEKALLALKCRSFIEEAKKYPFDLAHATYLEAELVMPPYDTLLKPYDEYEPSVQAQFDALRNICAEFLKQKNQNDTCFGRCLLDLGDALEDVVYAPTSTENKDERDWLKENL